MRHYTLNPAFGLLLVTTLLLLLISQQPAHGAPARQSGSSCVIPPSGPWPACATGGGSSNNSNSCVIPASGPWPACARSGGGTASSGGGSQSGSCVIPPSGPWPACATGGGGNNGGASGSCVIPPSGPWPACAKNDGGTASNNQNASLAELTGTWQAEIYPNTTFSGQATWNESINVIDYDWQQRSPQPRVPIDNWSGIWYRRIMFNQPTKLRLELEADDRATVKIINSSGIRILDWTADTSTGKRTTDITVPFGEALFRVEYVEFGGNASLEFRTYVVSQVPETANPQVQLFNVPNSVVAGGTASLQWQVTGLPTYARLTLVEQKSNSYVTTELRRVVVPFGTLNFPTASTSVEKNLLTYRYWLEYEGQRISAERTMQTDCTYQWFFFPANYNYANDEPSRRHTWGQCPTRPDISQASMQKFDGGLMIWIASRNQILVYASETNTLATYTDTFRAGIDPVTPEERLTPPSGKLLPQYGFGKLWSSNPSVRRTLGWATARPQNYTTVEQFNETDFRNDRGFLRLADSKVMFTGGARGIMQTQPRFSDINGFAHPNNGFRQPVNGACVIPPSGPWPPCVR